MAWKCVFSRRCGKEFGKMVKCQIIRRQFEKRFVQFWNGCVRNSLEELLKMCSRYEMKRITYPCGPVGDSEEVFREEWVPLQGIDGAVVPRVHCHNLLSRGLGLPVATDYCALLSAHHELRGLKCKKENYTWALIGRHLKLQIRVCPKICRQIGCC